MSLARRGPAVAVAMLALYAPGLGLLVVAALDNRAPHWMTRVALGLLACGVAAGVLLRYEVYREPRARQMWAELPGWRRALSMLNVLTRIAVAIAFVVAAVR